MKTIALVGCGRISERHLKVIEQIPDLKLVAVCDVKAERMDKAETVVLKDECGDPDPYPQTSAPRSKSTRVTTVSLYCKLQSMHLFAHPFIDLNVSGCRSQLRNEVFWWLVEPEIIFGTR